jgi:mono/diheme cytochrome c family protein
MKRLYPIVLLALLPATGIAQGADAPPSAERGRYLIAVGGCNDCHTPGYAERGEALPEAGRLLGVPVGFSGPWGVSYPTNLRLQAATLEESAWVERARAGGRPPMPWTALKAMTDADLRSVYRYLRALGPAGEPAPRALPPGAPIPTPHFVFVPQAPDHLGLAPDRR